MPGSVVTVARNIEIISLLERRHAWIAAAMDSVYAARKPRSASPADHAFVELSLRSLSAAALRSEPCSDSIALQLVERSPEAFCLFQGGTALSLASGSRQALHACDPRQLSRGSTASPRCCMLRWPTRRTFVAPPPCRPAEERYHRSSQRGRARGGWRRGSDVYKPHDSHCSGAC